MKSHFQTWLDKEHHYSRTDHYLKTVDKELLESGFLKKGEKITQIINLSRLSQLRSCYSECFEYKSKNKIFLYNTDLCMALYMHYVIVQDGKFHNFEYWLASTNTKLTVRNEKSKLLQYKKEKAQYYKNKIA